MEPLDSDDFGPMMQAEYLQQDNTELEVLKQKHRELQEAKRLTEVEFGQQRAKFMEIFKQKEDDLRQTRENLNVAQSQSSKQDIEISSLKEQLKRMNSEINDVKTVAAIADVSRTDEVDKLQRKYQDELASLQSIIKELTNQAEQSSSARYEQEISKLVQQKEKLELELQTTRSRLHRDREGILTSLTKTLQKRVTIVDPREMDEENLEYSMKKAQEDTEKLRTLLAPFEEEISSLKSQLTESHEHIAYLESVLPNNVPHASKETHSSNEEPLCDKTADQPNAAMNLSTDGHPELQSSPKSERNRPKHDHLDSLHRQVKRPCSECKKHQAAARLLQENEKQLTDRLSSLEHLLENEKQARQQLESYKNLLEKNISATAAESKAQISTLVNRLAENEKFLDTAKRQFTESKQQLQEQMNVMASFREDLQTELTKLQDNIDELAGKHSKFAQELQEEFINLPDSVEEIQVLLLKYREELITAKVGKEHSESILQKELASARALIQQKSTQERTLAQEINQLREELAIRNSLYSDLELKLRDSETIRTISSLTTELNDCKTAKGKLERTVHQQQTRIDAMRKDCTNSEAIQKDFVQFSQSLQIELDKYRMNDREVRWQHPDDVTQCGLCQRSFDLDAALKKENCRHCGHIFCKGCLNQSFPSGSNRRQTPVCLSCHEILVKAQENASDNSNVEMLTDQSC